MMTLSACYVEMEALDMIISDRVVVRHHTDNQEAVQCRSYGCTFLAEGCASDRLGLEVRKGLQLPLQSLTTTDTDDGTLSLPTDHPCMLAPCGDGRCRDIRVHHSVMRKPQMMNDVKTPRELITQS